MSYETKMSALEAILADHNKAMQASVNPATPGMNKAAILDIQLIKNNLLIMGATSEQALAQSSFEDLESCGIPKLLAKTVAQVFRNGPTPEKQKDGLGWVSERSAERMTLEELVARYNPEQTNAISKKLASLSHGGRFLAFSDGNTVDVATSVKLLDEIQKGYGERPLGGINVDGVMKPLYKVGEKPDNLVDENPLYPGRALRPDGTCDQLNRSWAGVGLKIRQIIFLVKTEKEIGNITIEGAHTILDMALMPSADMTLSARYPKAAMAWEKASKQGTLPTLKIELGKQVNKPNDPRVTIIR